TGGKRDGLGSPSQPTRYTSSWWLGQVEAIALKLSYLEIFFVVVCRVIHWVRFPATIITLFCSLYYKNRFRKYICCKINM
ncbi:hypothetical protein C2G38_2091809, partial [Gigaspora rosea]